LKDDEIFLPFAEGYGLDWVDNTFSPQSLVFYSQLLPVVYQCGLSIRNLNGNVVRIADVGAASGSGSNLTANVLNNLLGVDCEVTAFDLEGRFESYAKFRFPNIKYLIEDILQVDSGYFDLFLISHTLEHIPDPLEFAESLRSGNSQALQIYYVPWKEVDLIPGHLTSFNEDILSKVSGLIYSRVLRSVCWRTTDDSEVLIFITGGDKILADKRFLLNITTQIDKEFSTYRVD
jgi:SAM-dependent methyltransferase